MRLKLSQFFLHAIMAIALTTAGCLDRTDFYKNLSDAKEKRLFEKGWLPEILPPSTQDIEVTTSVEVSAGEGRFNFSSKEYGKFTENLQRFDGIMPNISEKAEVVRRRKADEYQLWSFAEGATSWIFMCKPDVGVCEFVVWQP